MKFNSRELELRAMREAQAGSSATRTASELCTFGRGGPDARKKGPPSGGIGPGLTVSVASKSGITEPIHNQSGATTLGRPKGDPGSKRAARMRAYRALRKSLGAQGG